MLALGPFQKPLTGFALSLHHVYTLFVVGFLVAASGTTGTKPSTDALTYAACIWQAIAMSLDGKCIFLDLANSTVLTQSMAALKPKTKVQESFFVLRIVYTP